MLRPCSYGYIEAFTFQTNRLGGIIESKHIHTKSYRTPIHLFPIYLQDFTAFRKVNGALPISSLLLLRRLKGNIKRSILLSFKPLFMGGSGNKDGPGKDVTAQDEILLLQQENKLLRENVAVLEQENRRLERQVQNRIVIEQFEGEGKQKYLEPWWDGDEDDMVHLISGGERIQNETILVTRKSQTLFDLHSSPIIEDDDVCTEWNEDDCPVEPDISFQDALRDRAYWLVGLLIAQSLSGFILSRNEELLRAHPVIIYFLTMLVGAGGNAGNQASVRGTTITFFHVISFFI